LGKIIEAENGDNKRFFGCGLIRKTHDSGAAHGPAGRALDGLVGSADSLKWLSRNEKECMDGTRRSACQDAVPAIQ
jgi:hypothetical protein